MSALDQRPRLAIVGGGGAMGRLFARYLSNSVRALYLLDLFGVGPRPASLPKTVEDLRLAAEGRGQVVRARALELTGATGAAGARLAPGPLDARSTAALLRIGPADAVADVPPQGAAVDLATLLADDAAGGCLVVAGPPDLAHDLLPLADVTLLALGFEDRDSYANTLGDYAPWFRPGSLVVDLGSTKTGPLEVLQRAIRPEVGLMGAHPLFGPTVSDLTGLIVATVPPDDARADSAWREWFLAQLARLRIIVTSTSAAEHDDAMAFVQALTHFTLLAFAYTFVRLDRDPADLLPLRTPVFEPLLYLAARVAYLARATPDTYRSIQVLSTRPDARLAFLDAARELLGAIEQSGSDAGALADLFQRFGAPWSPEGRDRRDRQRREHFLEMGARLVDDLNHLRQEVVAAAGQVRAVEERRGSQPARIVIGVVDLDLLDPGKWDVASRIRLRRMNLPLGSVLGESAESGADYVIPLSRARLLADPELLDWLFRTDQLVERRAFSLRVPRWFDHEVLTRLLRGLSCDEDDAGKLVFAPSGASQVWDASLEASGDEPSDDNRPRRVLSLAIVAHPAELLARRRAIQRTGVLADESRLAGLDAALADTYHRLAGTADATERAKLDRAKDRLKHERKAAIDRRAAAIDRAVRRATRDRVQRIAETALQWLLEHGCEK